MTLKLVDNLEINGQMLLPFSHQVLTKKPLTKLTEGDFLITSKSRDMSIS